MIRCLVLFFICTIGLCIHPGYAHCNDNPDDLTAKAKQAFVLGRDLFAEKKYGEAADAFRSAYEIVPTWKLLFNLGQAEAAAKRYDLAISSFEQYLADAGDDIAEERSQEVIAEIKRLRMLVGIVEVNAPMGAALYVDGVLRGTLPFNGPMRVAIGTHTLKLIHNDNVLLEREITVAGGMTTAVTVQKVENELNANEEEGPPHETSNTMDGINLDSSKGVPAAELKNKNVFLIGGVSSTAVGAAGIAVGIVFTVKYSNDDEMWKESARAYELSGRLSDYEAANTAHGDAVTDSKVLKMGYISGGVCLVAGVVLLAIHGKKKRKNKLSLLPSSGLRFSF